MRLCSNSRRVCAKGAPRALALAGAGIEPLEDRLLLFAAAPAQPPASVGNPVTIDLLAAYTPQARDAAGSDAAMLSRIQSDIADVNQAFVDSNIYVTIHLSGTTLVSYNDTGDLTTDLVRLQNTSDGYVDNVPSLRDQLGADLVALYSATPDPQSSDLAYLMDDPNATGSDAFGYCTLLTQPVGPRYALAQAIGFNLGATLDRDSTSTPGAYAYSYGYRFTINGQTYRDLMSRNPGTLIPYYSNPDLLYQGVAIGAADDAPNPSNVAKTLNINAPVAAAYRSRDLVAPSVSSFAAQGITVASSSPYTFTVTYADNRAINTSSLDSSDILLTGPNGFSQLASFVSVDTSSAGTPRMATYRATAPGGAWDSADNGTYTITLQGSQVSDVAGNPASAGTIGSFEIAIPCLVNLAPQTPAGFASPLIIAASATATSDAAQFLVNQTLFARFGLANLIPGIAVSGNVKVSLTLDGRVIASPILSAASLQSLYASAGISLGTLAAGRHTLRMQIDPQNTIAEANESDNVLERTFTVLTRDTAPPTAKLRAAAITRTSATPFQFSVTYIDNRAVNAATLGKGDLIVTGPKNYKCVATLVSKTPAGSAAQVTAIYSITAPGKAWDKTAAGVYTVLLQPKQVGDSSGNLAAAKTLGTFAVFAKTSAALSKPAPIPSAAPPITAPWWLKFL